MAETIEISQVELVELKKLYECCKKTNKPSFLFHGHEILTSYAKYLIEYLETRLNK